MHRFDTHQNNPLSYLPLLFVLVGNKEQKSIDTVAKQQKIATKILKKMSCNPPSLSPLLPTIKASIKREFRTPKQLPVNSLEKKPLLPKEEEQAVCLRRIKFEEKKKAKKIRKRQRYQKVQELIAYKKFQQRCISTPPLFSTKDKILDEAEFWEKKLRI